MHTQMHATAYIHVIHCTFNLLTILCRFAYRTDAGELSLTQQIAQVGNGSSASDIAVACQAWQDAHNIAAYYGPVLVYPAAYMVVTCNGTRHQSQFDDLPVCRDAYTDTEPYAAQLDNFWSTSAQGRDQKPVSSILLGVQLRDEMNQSMSLGNN